MKKINIIILVLILTLTSSIAAAGAKKNGLVTEPGKTYFYKNGKKVRGTKWVRYKKKKYYLKKSVVQKNKFLIIKRNKYRFAKKGALIKNKWILVKRDYYRAKKSGVIIRNKKGVKIGKKKYDFNKKGVCLNKKYKEPDPSTTSPKPTSTPVKPKPTEVINIKDPEIQSDIDKAMKGSKPIDYDGSTYDKDNPVENYAYVITHVIPENEVQSEIRHVLMGYVRKYLSQDSVYDDRSFHLQIISGTAYYTTDGSEPSPDNGKKVTKNDGLIKISPTCQHTNKNGYGNYDGIYNIKIHIYNSEGKLVALKYLYQDKSLCPHDN